MVSILRCLGYLKKVQRSLVNGIWAHVGDRMTVVHLRVIQGPRCAETRIQGERAANKRLLPTQGTGMLNNLYGG